MNEKSLGDASHVRHRITPFVPPHERDVNGDHPQRYPLLSDRYRVHHQPTIRFHSRDHDSFQRQCESGHRRLEYDRRIHWANRPGVTHERCCMAKISGHVSGATGKKGNMVTPDIDPMLGGQYLVRTAPLHIIKSFQ